MVTDALGEKADATFYFPLLTFMFGYVALCWIGLFIAELLTRRWYSDRQKTKVRDLYEGSWVGLFHHDDEAISALANVRSLNNAIIPTNFLVPMFSLIPLLITIAGVGYILFVLVHSVGPGTPELKNAIAQLGTGAPENELKWDLHSLGSVLSDLLKLVIFIMGPVLAGYLLLTTLGVGLFRAFAHMIGIPLAKAIDNLVWDSVRQDTWGNDRRGERVRGVSTHPPLFAPRYVALPDAIASKLTSNSERYATETMHKVREVLGATATVPTANDIGRDLSQQLSWKGLIHTTYFDSDEFIDLFAAAMRQAGLDSAKTGSTKGAVSEELVQQWLKDIATLPAVDTAATPATA